MEQKVIKIGSSVGMTFPKHILKELGIAAGDRLSVQVDSEKKILTVAPADIVDAELVSWTKKFIKKYRPALEALKDK